MSHTHPAPGSWISTSAGSSKLLTPNITSPKRSLQKGNPSSKGKDCPSPKMNVALKAILKEDFQKWEGLLFLAVKGSVDGPDFAHRLASTLSVLPPPRAPGWGQAWSPFASATPSPPPLHTRLPPRPVTLPGELLRKKLRNKWISLVAQRVKNLQWRTLGSIPGSGRSPGEGHGNPLPSSRLENSMDREACWATVHGVAKCQTQLSD